MTDFFDHFCDDDREKLTLAQHFVRCYLASRAGLKELGILRTERSLQGDYAEWLVSKLLDLELAISNVQKGYDAIDQDGKCYQIKSRIVKSLDSTTSFDMRPDIKFDYLVGVLFSESFELLAVIRVPYDVFQKYGSLTRTTLRFRWNRHSRNDPRVTRIVWPKNQ